MKVYGQSYWDVLKLPLRTFWSLNRQVNRLRAEEDIRSLRIHAVAQSSDAAAKHQESLVQEIGTPAVVEKPFNEDQFLELQRKLAHGK